MVADCEALWDFYRIQDDKSAFNGAGTEAWNPATSLADWGGVTVTAGRVTELDLWTYDKTADSLADLTALKRLSLSKPAEYSGLTGQVPARLGNLTSLEVLVMLGVEGPIPPELGNLTNLRELHLPYSRLSGPIPPELGNLTNLQELRLVGNELSEPIPPELGNLTNLQHLDLSHNRLSGRLPPELGNLTNLTILNVGSNDLFGAIPIEFGNLTSLEL